MEAITINKIDVDIPTPGAHRVKVSITSLRNVETEIVRRKINKHLCHSNYTTEKYYEFTNDDDAILAYTEIQKLSNK